MKDKTTIKIAFLLNLREAKHSFSVDLILRVYDDVSQLDVMVSTRLYNRLPCILFCLVIEIHLPMDAKVK